MKRGGGPFGAVVTRNGKKLSEAYNRVVPDSDPTAHAEILAIRKAASKLKNHDLSDCVIYSSCEPCPMCLSAIYWSGIKKIFFVLDRNDAAEAGFNDRFIYEDIARDPADKKLTLVRLDYPEGREVFKAWNILENKIPY